MYQYGFLTGRIVDTESLFWYEEGKDSADYQDPSFEAVTDIEWGSVDERVEADELCQGDQACIYDLFVTKDRDFATNTLNISVSNEDSEQDLGKLTMWLRVK